MLASIPTASQPGRRGRRPVMKATWSMLVDKCAPSRQLNILDRPTLNARSQHMNWTESKLQFARTAVRTAGRVEMHVLRTNRPLAAPVSPQPINTKCRVCATNPYHEITSHTMSNIQETFVRTLPGIAGIKTFKGWSNCVLQNFKRIHQRHS